MTNWETSNDPKRSASDVKDRKIGEEVKTRVNDLNMMQDYNKYKIEENLRQRSREREIAK